MIALFLVIAVVFLILSAVFSGTETGIYSLERVRLQLRASRGDRVAARLLRLAGNAPVAICTLLVANNAANLLLTASAGRVLDELLSAEAGAIEVWNTAVVVPLLFVFGELVPKSLFLSHPVMATRACLPVYLVAERLVRPFAGPLLWLIRRLSGGESPAREMLERTSVIEALTTGDEAEVLRRSQRMMVARLVELRQIRVEEVMVRRSGVAAVPATAGRDEILGEAARTGRSRVLVMEPDGERFQGYVTVLDAILDEDVRGRRPFQVHALPRVAPSDTLADALRVLRKSRRPLASVEAEGRARGLISAADIVDLLFPPPAPEAAPGGGS